MKKHVSKLVALALFAVAFISAAVAQDSVHAVRANIPFKFYAGSQLLPAGEYTISVNPMSRLVTIGQKEPGSSSLLLGSPDDKSRGERTVLRFKLVGDEVYALSELQGPDVGVSFRAKQSERAVSAQNKNQTLVVVAEAR